MTTDTLTPYERGRAARMQSADTRGNSNPYSEDDWGSRALWRRGYANADRELQRTHGAVSIATAREQGVAAGQRGDSELTNPYRVILQYSAWHQGWLYGTYASTLIPTLPRVVHDDVPPPVREIKRRLIIRK